MAGFGLAVCLSCAAAFAQSDGEAVVPLDQGWDEAARNAFYHLPQGSPIMPYAWFLALEQPDKEALFREDEFLKSFGLLSWNASPLNPGGLPIGLTFDRGLISPEPQLGMNCAACHVAEIKIGDKRVLIDGGVSHFDFWSFVENMLLSLQRTSSDDEKFTRFAGRVLGDELTAATAKQLRARLKLTTRTHEDWAIRNATGVKPGPGRVDALNVIINQIAAGMLHRPDNAHPADAPVSFPYLWDAPYLDFVQINGVIPNDGPGAVARNVGQVLGVFGEVSVIEQTLPTGYASSVRVDHLMELEERLEALWSPAWAELAEKKILPPLDENLIGQGSDVYMATCAGCHKVIDRLNRGDLASIPITRVPQPVIGTDPAAAYDFAAREVASGPLQGRKAMFVEGEPMCERVHGNAVVRHVIVAVMMNDLSVDGEEVASKGLSQAVSTVTSAVGRAWDALGDSLGLTSNSHRKIEEADQHLIRRMAAAGASEDKIVAALKARREDKAELYHLLVEDTLKRPAEDIECLGVIETAQYRARPLNGIWATGPFLHNGSVPSLRDLLEPAVERPKTFHVGNTAFDVDAVGFASGPTPGGFFFDTSIPGNDNAGHQYGTALSEADKRALLEYLKNL